MLLPKEQSSDVRRNFSGCLGAFVIALFLLAGSTVLPTRVQAASLSISPVSSATSFAVGQTFSVAVYVATTPDKPVNAISAVINFPDDKLQVVSLDKNGGIIDFWIGTDFSNSGGKITVEGGTYNPGYSGGRGKVITINFRAKAKGTATLSFSNVSVLANDGNGTPIFDRAGTATINIVSAPPPTATPPPEAKPVGPSTPRLNTLPASISPNDVLQISGTADPHNEITVYIRGSSGGTARQSTASDAAGKFSITWSSTLSPDAYAVNAEAKNTAGLTSPRSPDITVFVREAVEKTVFPPLFMLILLAILLGILIILGIAILWYFIHKVSGWRRTLRGQVKAADRRIHEHFEDLKEAISDHIQSLEREAGRRELTSNEEAIIRDMNKYLRSIEEAIEHEVSDIDG